MPTSGWLTVSIRASHVELIRSWSQVQAIPPKTSQVVADALRDWFAREGLELPPS